MVNKNIKDQIPHLETMETYLIREEGSHVFLVRDSWQMVKLNYTDKYSFEKLGILYKHERTDKGIALIRGKAFLMAMENDDGKLQFEFKEFSKEVCYNIPRGTWYSFIMEIGSELIFVEKPNTQEKDTATIKLDELQLEQAKKMFSTLKYLR